MIVISGYYKTKYNIIPISHTFLYDDTFHKGRLQSSPWTCPEVNMNIDIDNNVRLTFPQHGNVYLSARVIPFSSLEPCFSFKKVTLTQTESI
ncbi:Hypothetical protein ORPV_1133 [Orpheovirus IHUMI-LCC2]|uniref:Uncharacterized protein n=2 Tax=Orpheovirus IHUMI-LCC2 TaxID=2023057 RepID=A0A2I2L682_9VIRU|nr:Hypothetical protein ORPV_1133 [Orpheovirus IHUMI-LCC2]SNW63037.1 Hypothetical protein ORPV_1133 [Orpheovirus IHUMI-LCC2]